MTDYERYQLEWMIDHGHSLGELMSELTNLQNDLELTPGVNLSVADVFETWEEDRGFGGEVWACEAEYVEAEGKETAPENKVAIAFGSIFDLFDSKDALRASIALRDIQLMDTGVIVTVDGRDYSIHRGTSHEDYFKIEQLLNVTHGKLIRDYRKPVETDVAKDSFRPLQRLRRQAGYRSAADFAKAASLPVADYVSYERGRIDAIPAEAAGVIAKQLADSGVSVPAWLAAKPTVNEESGVSLKGEAETSREAADALAGAASPLTRGHER